MFDAVRSNRKIVQIFLALITIPFALWGLDSYFQGNGGGEDTVATVGSVKISERELTEAVSDQRENMRAQMGESFNQAMTERPEFRAAVLDSLINRSALSKRVSDAKLSVSDSQLQQYIQTKFVEFQDNGKFSKEQYEAVLRSNGRTPISFERDLRQSLALQSMVTPIAESVVTSKAVLERWLSLQDEERVVAEVMIESKAFENQVKLASEAAKTFYDANKTRYEVPEKFKLEFAELSAEALSAQIFVADADVRKWYDEHLSAYTEPEERRASHILIEVPEKASAADDAAAKAKAEGILAKVKADPASFAKLAKSSSSDTLSAEAGGDLGFFGRGAMDKAFEDAAFALKQNEISGLVKTQFGYHIIQLTELRGGKAKPFDSVKTQITDELKKSLGNKKFAEAAEQFTNMVYEQADTFKPVGEKLPIKIISTDWVAKGARLSGPLMNEKVIAAYTNADAIKSRRNSEAIDIGNGRLVSVRVLDYQPAAMRPFEEVKAQIEKELQITEATKMAEKDGEAKLAKLVAGEPVPFSWGEAKAVKRTGALTPEARKAIFSAKTEKLPAYVGVASAGGYSIYRLDKVTIPKIAEGDNRLESLRSSYTQSMGEEDLRAFIKTLRDRFGAKSLDKAVSNNEG